MSAADEAKGRALAQANIENSCVDIEDDQLEYQVAERLQQDTELLNILKTHFQLTLRGVKRLVCAGNSEFGISNDEKFYSFLLDGNCDAARLERYYHNAIKNKTHVIDQEKFGLMLLRKRVVELLREFESQGVREASRLPVALCRREIAEDASEAHPRCFALLARVGPDELSAARARNLSERIMSNSDYGQRDLFLAPFVVEDGDLRLGQAELIAASSDEHRPMSKEKTPDRAEKLQKYKRSLDDQHIASDDHLSDIAYRLGELKRQANHSAWASLFILLVAALAIGFAITGARIGLDISYEISSRSLIIFGVMCAFLSLIFADLAREFARQIRIGIEIIEEYGPRGLA